jgi:DNA-binding NtrC family response regulator
VVAAILIVDDEPVVLDLGRQLFTNEGYRVFVAGSAAEAMDVLKANASEITLVLTDYAMPKTDGAELAIQIQEAYPKVYVIILSGFGRTLKLRATNAEVIDKPIDYPLLLQKVKKLIDPDK